MKFTGRLRRARIGGSRAAGRPAWPRLEIHWSAAPHEDWRIPSSREAAPTAAGLQDSVEDSSWAGADDGDRRCSPPTEGPGEPCIDGRGRWPVPLCVPVSCTSRPASIAPENTRCAPSADADAEDGPDTHARVHSLAARCSGMRARAQTPGPIRERSWCARVPRS